jgi:hypothetical protein
MARRRRAITLVLSVVTALVLSLGLASAAQATPVQFYYVPFPEDQLLNAFQSINAANPTEPITSYITITAVADDTVLYWDQWENGYDTDIANTLDVYSAANPGGTQIWGDGNAANGIPPGFTVDEIDAGTVIDLRNEVVTTTRATVIDFDAGDKLAASKTVAMTRSSWAAVSLTMLAGSVEVFDTNTWGTDFRAPIGENIPDSADYQMFEYTAVSIMAGEAGATVQIDANADNTFETTVTLDEGESHFVDGGIYLGAHIVADEPIQVDIFSGDVGSNYESRDSALIPTGTWSSDYYTPVSTASSSQGYNGTDTTAWLYNPGTSDISVSYVRRVAGVTTTSTLTVPAGSYLKQVLPDGTGAHFYSTGAPFYAFSTTDSNSGNTDGTGNQAWDWGYTMIPRYWLTTQALVGLGIGRDPTSAVNPLENGNPVWVTPVGNGETATTVYVDYDADPTTGLYTDPSGNGYDASYSLKELERAKVLVAGLAVDATSQGTTGTSAVANTLTISHTTGTAANRLMLVGVAVGNVTGTMRNVASVTYGGTALTRVGTPVTAPTGGSGDPDAQPQVELWALVNPPSGTANVVITLDGTAPNNTRSIVAGVTTFSGVDISAGLTSALGTFASNSANAGTTQSVNVTTVAGQMVYDVVAAARYGNADPSAFTLGANQTSRWTQYARAGNNSLRMRGAGSTEVATGTTTAMSWTSTTSYAWAMAAVPVNGIKASQTGILLYTLDVNVKLAVAWGQDTLNATPGSPGLDVGTSTPPMPEFTAAKDGVLATDNDDDGYISAGDILEYDIFTYNVSRLPVPDIIIYDHAPDSTLHDTTYVAGSTVLYKDQNGDGVYETTTAIPDNVSGTPFPLDGAGYTVSGNLLPGGEYKVTFLVTLDAPEDLVDWLEIDGVWQWEDPPTAILNAGSGSALNIVDNVDDKSFLRGRIGDYVWWDIDMDGIQDAGENGLEGVIVRLLDKDGDQLYDPYGNKLETFTDADGYYLFTGLPPADYIVEFVAPSGAGFSPQDAGGESVDSDPNATTGRTAVFSLNGGQRKLDVDAGLYRITPTVVVVSSFDAAVARGKVVVSWETASEANTAGFYVERLDGKAGDWVRVNSDLVPALLESSTGGTYSVVDRGARPNETVTYRLVEMEMAGSLNYYGPFEVTPTRELPAGEASDRIAEGSEAVRIPEQAPGGNGDAPQLEVEQLTTGVSTGDRLRIEVTAAGLYRIGAAEMAAGLGLSEEQAVQLIRTKGIKLTSHGRNVAYLQAPDFTALYFYGQALDSIYDSTNVYWLAMGKGTTVVAAKPASAKAAVSTTFTDRLHVEEDVFPITEQFHEIDSDFWLWSYLAAGFAPLTTKTFAIDVPDSLAGVQLQVTFRGLTITGIANEHHAIVRLNGVDVGETRWTGMASHTATFALPAGSLNAGANEVAVTAVLDAGVPYSLFAVDSIDVSYQRATVAQADRLTLTAPAAGSVEVTGLSSADAWVLDLSNPFSPQSVRVTASGGDPGAVWLRFNAVKGRPYLVATAAGARDPDSIVATTGTTLRSAGAGAQYVVITTPALAEAAGRLAAYRVSQGLSALVVTTDDIYDEFSYGLATPHGIRSFIKYASSTWTTPVRYVVLAGEGSYDYKDFMSRGDSLVPPLMVDTEYGLAPSDVALADVAGADGAPEVAIGRIPALTVADLDAALAEIEAYEAASGAGGGSSVLLAADNTDSGGSFMSDSDVIGQELPSSLNVVKAYLDRLPADAVRSALLRAFGDGSVLVNYVGHGGEDVLAAEALLAKGDAASLPAGARLPIFTAFTCKVGQFAVPGYDSLGEALVKQQGAGAIAVWSPSAMEDSVDSARLGTIFTQCMFGSTTQVVLGDVIRSAMKGAAGKLPASLLLTYNLLGDPALRVSW